MMIEELNEAAAIHAAKVIEARGYPPCVTEDFINIFQAGADWHKSRAWLTIIQDIQKTGGILIVEPVGGCGTGAVAVEPNGSGGVTFTKIRETEVFKPEFAPPILPDLIDRNAPAIFGDGPAFSFPGKKYQFPDPNPGFPKRKKGFHQKGKRR